MRIILASTQENVWILDLFTGSSTTGITANLIHRNFIGIDQEKEFLELSKKRKLEIEDEANGKKMLDTIMKLI